MTRMFFLIPRLNEDIINKENNEHIQVLFEHFVHQIHEATGALANKNGITTNS